jgi:hypothetical protein
VYLDDILVFQKAPNDTWSLKKRGLRPFGHQQIESAVAQVSLSPPGIEFLGHVASADGIAPDPAIVNWPISRSLIEVRSFLGLAKILNRLCIEPYAQIAAPLTTLLKGSDKADRKGRLLQKGKLKPEQEHRLVSAFEQCWTTECDKAFGQLKHALVHAPVLVLPDFETTSKLVCDACDVVIGGISLQWYASFVLRQQMSFLNSRQRER